ncbi:MAG: hypothetical protein ACOC39_01165 [Desulfovermiculus sp.]
MSTCKGRVLDLKSRLEGKKETSGSEPRVILRGNELYRLLSLINKIKWGRELSAADEHDLQEIEDIEQRKRPLLQAGNRFFPPAFSRHDEHGVLSWFQDLRQGPIRALSTEEAALFRQVGPIGFHGYLRLDGTIQAYLLSGSDAGSIPAAYLRPDPKS